MDRPTTVLMADESELFLMGLRQTIEKTDAFKIVGQTTSGRESLAMVANVLPDILILDLVLPDIDGFELIETIKREYPDTRILIITADDDPNTIRKVLSAGARGFCRKRIHGEQLMNAIESVAYGAVWLSPGIADSVRTTWSSSPRNGETGRSRNMPAGGESLSKRETEILSLMVDGQSNYQMAEQLNLSVETIKTHVRHIYEKMCVRHRTEAVVAAIRRGLIQTA